ncbi:MAG: helix-turn-helix domain-containing protein [Candidatus Eisenbacteria sp.]|nr:helix-turn-helix domain-containing protein [Candidatus Eisenbacteria bacterium]
MRCNECGGTYVPMRKPLQITDRYTGPLTVEGIEYLKCDRCGDYLFSPEAAKRIGEARAHALDTILQSQPLSAFVPAPIAADMLGISRQALHKHRRIRRGFIFQAGFGDKTVYLRESVLRFKAAGDGRFPLWSAEEQVEYAETQRVVPAVPYEPEQSRFEIEWAAAAHVTVEPKTHNTGGHAYAS